MIALPVSTTVQLAERDVPAPDATHLVGEHRFELVARELLGQAGGDAEDRLPQSGADTEGVGRRVVDHREPRRGDPAGDRDAFEQVPQLQVRPRLGDHRAGLLQHAALERPPGERDAPIATRPGDANATGRIPAMPMPSSRSVSRSSGKTSKRRIARTMTPSTTAKAASATAIT